MRGLINNLIRLSKQVSLFAFFIPAEFNYLCNIFLYLRGFLQRVDAEKSRHRTITTSDPRLQIMTMNRKAREEWERKQAEAEKLRKLNEVSDSSAY